VLGVVQGVAEVLPVSSSAQLSLLPWLLDWEPAADRTGFAAGLHAGSTIGLAAALRADLATLDRRTTGRLVLSTVPAALAGLLGGDLIESRLGRPGPTAALLATAGALLWAADTRPSSGTVGTRDLAAAAGAQVLALAPGVSRSGATITAFRARAVQRQDAFRTSLLMSLPVTAGAAGLTVLRTRSLPPPVPTALAAGAAYVTARRVDGASSRVLSGSAVYRLALATAVAVRLSNVGRLRRGTP
jgi:undecaprenyl-diphosphatase